MIRKVSLFLLLLCVMLITLQDFAFGSTYFVYDDWAGTWHDANKNYIHDSNMCWAASASNVLAFTGGMSFSPS